MKRGKHIWMEAVPKAVMSEAGLPNLFRAIGCVGTVKAVMQDYQVLRTAGGEFLVFSPSNRESSSFHMTKVSGEKADALGSKR